MTDSDISVIIPTYNGSAFIADALRSVFAQTRLPKEIIVVDDCSTDGTIAIVEQLRGESPVSLIFERLARNSGGPAKPINTGVARAAGSIISILDQDDVFLPNTLDRAQHALDQNKGAGFAFHWCAKLSADIETPFQSAILRDELVAAGRSAGSSVRLAGPYLFGQLLQKRNFVVGFPGFVFQRSLWAVKGGIDESFRIAGDLDFLLWMSAHTDSVLIPEIGYLRREHSANACNNITAMHFEVGRALYHAVARTPISSPSSHRPTVVDALLGMAYSFREKQKYAESIRLYQMCMYLGESKSRTMLRIGKVLCHRLLRLAQGRSTTETASAVASRQLRTGNVVDGQCSQRDRSHVEIAG